MVAPISVIIPCYRCADTIGRAVDSVLSQTRPVAEIILVDDASDDGTSAVLYSLQKKYHDHSINVIECEQNGGPGGARNAGWGVATQPWVALLDADDAWHPQKIELQFGWLERQNGAALCAHNSELWQDDFDRSDCASANEAYQLEPNVLLFKNTIPTRSVIMRRDLPFRFGGKDVAEDYLMWLTVAFSGYSCWKMRASLACSFRDEFSPGGYSGALWTHEKRELRCYLKLYRQDLIGLFSLVPASIFSLLKFFRRHLINRFKHY